MFFADFDVDNGILPYMTYMATMHMLVKNEHMQDRRARPVHIIHSGHLEGQRSTYAQMEIVVKLPGGFSKISVPSILDFLWFWRSVEGLESSGRPVGFISTKWRPSNLPWSRVMTEKPKKLTSKKVTSIKV